MIKLTDEQIKNIAEELECGMRCYYHNETSEIKSILDFDKNPGADPECWEEDLNEIEEHYDDYIEFEGMESHESFKIMEDFATWIDDLGLKSALFGALSRKHPFRNFKNIIDNSGPYRQEWFDFKSQRYIEWVKDIIAVHNRREEEDIDE
jgi:hypothetical protein